MARRTSFVSSLNKLNRSMAAAARAHEQAIKAQERLAQSRARAYFRNQKEWAKLNALQQARYEVECYESQIELLTGIHKQYSAPFDWGEVMRAPEPRPPHRATSHETLAQKELDAYSPGFWDRLFKRDQKLRAALEEKVQWGRTTDDRCHQEALAKHAAERQEWESMRDLAQRILSHDSEAMEATLEHYKSLYGEMAQLGVDVTLAVAGNGSNVEFELCLNPSTIVPLEVKSLVASGKCSAKKMPNGRYAELLQGFVCGCVLRVARETFALVPIDMAFLHVVSQAVNPSTGLTERKAILSAAIDRDTLDGVKLEAVNASDCIRNFTHRMDFNKTRRFLEVERIDPASFVSVAVSS